MTIKMLYPLALVLISITYVMPKATFVNVTPEQLPILFNIFTACIDKTGADSNTMQKVMGWNLEDNDSVKKYIFCLAQDSGYGDNNGYLVRDKIVELIGNHNLKSEFINAIDECNKFRGNDKYDTLFKATTCIRDTSPILFKI